MPTGCKVDISHAGVNFPSAKEASSHEDEPTVGPSKADGPSGESEEITPKRLDAVDGRSAARGTIPACPKAQVEQTSTRLCLLIVKVATVTLSDEGA